MTAGERVALDFLACRWPAALTGKESLDSSRASAGKEDRRSIPIRPQV
jgi:hypothetical protein